MKVDVTAIIEIPRVPNFLKMDNGETIPISALKDDSLREIGQAWTDNLIKRANEQRLHQKSGVLCRNEKG